MLVFNKNIFLLYDKGEKKPTVYFLIKANFIFHEFNLVLILFNWIKTLLKKIIYKILKIKVL